MAETPDTTGLTEPSLAYAPVMLAALLDVLAAWHRIGLDEPARYRGSLLVPLEFFLLIGTVFALLGIAVAGLVAAVRGDWRFARHAVAGVMLAAVLIVLATWIDAPTLLYLT